MSEAESERPVSTDLAKVVYVLYLAAVITGVTALIGVVMAYIYRDEAPGWLKTHYEFQIRTFWLMILYAIGCTILTFVLIGALLFVVLAVWWIVRCVKGIQYLDRRAAYPNPEAWAF
jgi:uncharacterized membrane protein